MMAACYHQCLLLLCSLLLIVVNCNEYGDFVISKNHYVESSLNYTYVDNEGIRHYKIGVPGKFGRNRATSVQGILSLARTVMNKSDACSSLQPGVPLTHSWIALVQRGNCNFSKKVENTVVLSNASAVIVFNHLDNDLLVVMDHSFPSKVALFISHSAGEELVGLLEQGYLIELSVAPTDTRSYLPEHMSPLSVMFVSISFIILMMISLAWLIFYYVQRFRYAHAKDRLQRRLTHAARRAISSISTKVVKSGDEEIDPAYDPCAVCIEGYCVSDVLRILPCNHRFHKSCIDPWLLEHRTCPMCKLDILKAYGQQLLQLKVGPCAEPDALQLDEAEAVVDVGDASVVDVGEAAVVDAGNSGVVEVDNHGVVDVVNHGVVDVGIHGVVDVADPVTPTASTSSGRIPTVSAWVVPTLVVTSLSQDDLQESEELAETASLSSSDISTATPERRLISREEAEGVV